MADPKKGLRALGENEKPPAAAKVKGVLEAAEGGNQLELLVSMRNRVAKAVQDPNCPPRDLAALTRRLQEIAREIEAIEAKAKQEADEDGDSRTPDEAWDAEAI
jgi:hypothetical protein